MEEFIAGRNPTPKDDPPVTTVVIRRAKQGRKQEFEEWLSGILAAASQAPGYLGSEVFRHSDNEEDDDYRVIVRFDHASNLHAWENSEERHRWLRKVEPLAHEEKGRHVLTGLETWFTLPTKPGEPSPPRYKMAIVTWLAVFPVVVIIFAMFGQWLNLLPTLVRALVFTAVMVTLMTYVIMPRMTRLFSFWLYPDRK
jgi:antibiotic biosynthesis monooxygenase (ABM) superfamily enzyme